MEVPCVAVDRADGEQTRQALAKAGVLSDDYQIIHDDGTLYIPVTDSAGVPDGFETTFRALPARQTVQTPADILGYEPSLERLGDVVIVDEDDSERAHEIAEAVMAADLPVRRCSTVRRKSKANSGFATGSYSPKATTPRSTAVHRNRPPRVRP